MAIYREKENKLSLPINDGAGNISVTVNTFLASRGSLSWFFKGELCTAEKDQPTIIGSANQLKNKSIKFDGKSNNPSGSSVKMEYIFSTDNGELLKYTFPDDYTGTPVFQETDGQPAIKFTVTF